MLKMVCFIFPDWSNISSYICGLYSGYVFFLFLIAPSKSKQLLQKSTELWGWFGAMGGTTPRTAKHSGCPEALAHVAGAATPIHWPRLRRQNQCGGWVLKNALAEEYMIWNPISGFQSGMKAELSQGYFLLAMLLAFSIAWKWCRKCEGSGHPKGSSESRVLFKFKCFGQQFEFLLHFVDSVSLFPLAYSMIPMDESLMPRLGSSLVSALGWNGASTFWAKAAELFVGNNHFWIPNLSNPQTHSANSAFWRIAQGSSLRLEKTPGVDRVW